MEADCRSLGPQHEQTCKCEADTVSISLFVHKVMSVNYFNVPCTGWNSHDGMLGNDD